MTDPARLKIEEALKESEQRYRTILESIEEGYYEVDLKGRFVFFNKAFCRILGVSKKELTGRSYKEFTDEANQKKTFQTFNRVYTTGKPGRWLDWEIRTREGLKHFIEASIYLIRDAGGTPTGFRGIAREITERKEMELALKESEAKYRTLFEEAHSAIFLLKEDRFHGCPVKVY